MFTIEGGSINIIRAEGVPQGKMIVFITSSLCQKLSLKRS